MDTMPEYPGRILKTNEPARERRLMEQQAESDLLKKELYGLFKYLQRVRQEIAAINRPADEAVALR